MTTDKRPKMAVGAYYLTSESRAELDAANAARRAELAAKREARPLDRRVEDRRQADRRIANTRMLPALEEAAVRAADARPVHTVRDANGFVIIQPAQEAREQENLLRRVAVTRAWRARDENAPRSQLGGL